MAFIAVQVTNQDAEIKITTPRQAAQHDTFELTCPILNERRLIPVVLLRLYLSFSLFFIYYSFLFIVNTYTDHSSCQCPLIHPF